VPRLADSELTSLENYVRGGGGAAFFVGADTDRSFYNDRLYHDGQGLFPAPLKLPTQLLERGDTPDVEVTAHPIFQVLAGRRNGFLPVITVNYYYALQEGWLPPKDGTVQVIARVRNSQPLVIEKRFGKGRVVAQLTKLSSGDTPLGKWSNWSLNPAFPVLANELTSYLAAARQVDPLHLVGDDLAISVDEGKYDPHFRFILPAKSTLPKSAKGNVAAATGSSTSIRNAALPEVQVDATAAANRLTGKLEHVSTSGIYEARLQPTTGPVEHRMFAVNVPAGEGDLALTPNTDIARQLAGIDYQTHDAKDMALNAQQLAGFQMGDALLFALIVILLLEQLLAYLASYHVVPVRSTTR
jgi:hypothetical protein